MTTQGNGSSGSGSSSSISSNGNAIRDDRTLYSADYLAQLLKDKRQIQPFTSVFLHVERILDEEINRVRLHLFHQNANKEPLHLPEENGPVVTLTEKLYVPVKDFPEFNFVGRILGPRGMTAKQLEQETGCKIMVRGKGSMRDRRKEEMNRGKPNWEHLNEELHVLLTVEDTKNRAAIKLQRAVDEVKKLLVPSPEGEDDLKKFQLMELAIINGTYRENNNNNVIINNNNNKTLIMASPPPVTMMAPAQIAMSSLMRAPVGPAGAPIILAPRLPVYTTASMAASMPSPAMMNGPPPSQQPQPIVSPTEATAGPSHVLYQYDPYLTVHSSIFEFPTTAPPHNGLDQRGLVSMPYVR